MATLKICVQKQRNDGFYPVYIRVTHHRGISYIRTDKMASTKTINKKTKEIKRSVYYQAAFRVDYRIYGPT